jgi:hypothetical protein
MQLVVGVVCADPGFWSVESIDIPSGVRSAGESIYQIIVLETAPRGKLGRADAEPALSEQRKRRVEDDHKPPTEAPSGNIGLLYQLRSCLEQDQAQCDVHEVLAVGTAFLSRPDPNRIHVCTSYRNVAAAVQGGSEDEASAEQKPGERHVEIPIQLLLIDRHQRIVFDTRMESMSGVITGYAPRIDLALVQLSSTIGRPIPFYPPADASDDDLQDYYIAGFPIVQRPATKREDYYAYSLSRYELTVTIGEIFQDPRHRRTGKEPEYIECDADSAPGMSGAPVLDGNGQVIGMLSRSMSNQVGSILVPAAAIQGFFSD